MSFPFFSNYQFADPWWLLLLLLVPLLAWLRGRRGAAPTLAFPMVSLMSGLGRPTRSRRGGFVPNLLHLSLICGIIALARPQKLITHEEVKSEGIAICVAVDVSLSMLIEDYYAGTRNINRLVAAKRVLKDFIEGRPGDRIGIVAFAGAPYTPCPPTLDHDWILKNMDRIQTGVIEAGTAIGSGIAAAARRLDKQEAKSKVLVLITDGASNSGKLSPADAARYAATLGIKIYTIGVGTPGYHLIPMPNGGNINSFRDEFDEESLKQIAEIGGGTFFKAQDAATLKQVFESINKMEKTQIDRRIIVHTDDLFLIFIIAAAICILLYSIWKVTLARLAPITV
ncbi:MAG: VWA domain-containing protein [Verrucomicrobia bacterium]|nr:VWA domain-containing protein [Verrucomicrobiota bacterium]